MSPTDGKGADQATGAPPKSTRRPNKADALMVTELVAAAHDLHERGLHIFPTDHPDQPECIGLHGPKNPCDGERGKHPAVKWSTWGATVTPRMIKLAWTKRGGLANIAIACGPSNLVVLDEDEAGELQRWCDAYGIVLPDTYTVTTGRGEHRYFTWDHSATRIGNSKKAMPGFKLDVRGDGGYAIAEGSRHASGVVYTGNGAPIAELPEKVAAILLAAANVNGANTGADTDATDTGADTNASADFLREHADPNSTKIGHRHRHNELVAYAGRLRKSGLDLTEALPTFRQRWLLCEQPDGQIPEAHFHSGACPYPVTWEEAEAKLGDVYRRYAAGQDPGAGGNGQQPKQPKTSAQSITIEAAHTVFRKWLGESCDTDALDIMLATAVMQADEGDPVWLMLISGSGNAKTEMAQSLSGVGAEVTSAISSAGALLSATSKREKAANATGGLLRKLEKDGVGLLVVKDFTTLLSMNHNVRAEVLAALREIHDGRYQRNVGTDGGRTLTWEGRLVVIGACTTAWDRAHAVISVMGNRFVLVRVESEDDDNREEFGLQSIANLGSESRMRRELAETVASVIASASEPPVLTKAESLVLVRAANLATKARTAVEVDYQGNVEDSHAPEVPTRFAKQTELRPGTRRRRDRRIALARLHLRPGLSQVHYAAGVRMAETHCGSEDYGRHTGRLVTVHGAGGFGSQDRPRPTRSGTHHGRNQEACRLHRMLRAGRRHRRVNEVQPGGGRSDPRAGPAAAPIRSRRQGVAGRAILPGFAGPSIAVPRIRRHRT